MFCYANSVYSFVASASKPRATYYRFGKQDDDDDTSSIISYERRSDSSRGRPATKVKAKAKSDKDRRTLRGILKFAEYTSGRRGGVGRRGYAKV